ncbi:MAG: tRNA uridine-5-carboxymethylaminomethyl(34) synthesis GTPase MnmE [Muribaculaceae bacterium]|nr:tRNA uridine-5-carboxymethylaminomethyl(34) synthesis GTPase MnmE [Muribaculaceae bacterium]
MYQEDTIAAISTPQGQGGVAIIRISGPQALSTISKAWKGTDLQKVESHTLHLGKYFDTEGKLLDEALAALFKAPNSFTGEDVVELNIHGSQWLQKTILSDLIKRGIRIARPGEFTQRAFLNGKMDLTQAEGVADLIAASSKAAHAMAINQTRGGFSKEIEILRSRLIEFASLLELELDFSEEDVEFADRAQLLFLCNQIKEKIKKLTDSYASGEVLKNGVPVVIAGIPNAGKSSLLNLLLKEEKAIVTDIPGTTRDIIEDTVEINGILYRFIDTAGLRKTEDIVEAIGVKKAQESLKKAYIVIWLIDPNQNINEQIDQINKFKIKNQDKKLIVLINKSDLLNDRTENIENDILKLNAIPFSTLTQNGLKPLLEMLHEEATKGIHPETDIIVTNARHYESLSKALESVERVEDNLQRGISADLVAQDIRETLTHLATLTGAISSDTLLHSIFSRFCIGK